MGMLQLNLIKIANHNIYFNFFKYLRENINFTISTAGIFYKWFVGCQKQLSINKTLFGYNIN